MLNQKTLLMSVLVLAAFTLTTTGCGKSKKSRADVRGTTEAVQQTDVVQPDDQLVDTDGAGAPLPTSPENNGVGGLPGLPQSADSDNGGTLNPLPSSNGNNGSDLGELPTAGKGKKSNGAVSAKFDEAEAVKTGGKLDALNYTSSSADGLMAEFRGYNNKVNAEQKVMNLNLAKAVINAKLKRAAGVSDMLVDLTLDESSEGVKKITSYRLIAVKAGDKYSLSKISSTGDLEVQGGFLKCTDTDGGCDNAYIKVKMEGAYVRVIFRKSYADRFFILEEGSQGSSFELWKSYLNNTVNFASTSQKLDYVQTSSFEVVNGRSAMGVLIATEDKETVGLGIALLAADKGTIAGSNVAKVNDLSKNYDLTSVSNGSQNLAQAIKEAKLVNNNGKGEVRIRLDLSSGSQKAAMWLTLSNIQKASLSIAEIQGFESKIPKF